MNDRLTEHFARWEFTTSREATVRGIENVPDDEAWRSLQALAARVLEPARVTLGPLAITSGYRSPDLNAMIGGARGSQHMTGEAADVIPHGCSLFELFAWLHDNVPFDQLIWEYGHWVHVSHKRQGPQRGTVLLAASGSGRSVYTPITLADVREFAAA